MEHQLINIFPLSIYRSKIDLPKDISLLMFIIFTVGVFSWLVYGMNISNMPIIIANSITLILSIFILFYKIKFK